MIRVVTAGAFWAAAYNVLWGPAWVLPFGLVVAAYLSGRRDREGLYRDAVAASLVVWVPGTIGMAFGAAMTAWIIVLDSVVNLVALLVPSFLLAKFVRGTPTSARETEAPVSAS